MTYKSGHRLKNNQSKPQKFTGQSLYLELIQLLWLEIQSNNKNKSRLESLGKIGNQEGHKELKRLEENF